MAGFVFVFAAVCVAASAAPPAPPRLYQQHAPQQLQQINPLDYYLDHPEVHNYYNHPARQTQDNAANQQHSARLETLEPDSEVELIPGAQPPQQPPQQPPVAPSIPGLLPGQRVFIVHMPVPGYRPGTIGGYQPVYIVAAAPQGGPAGFPGSGYQNAVLLDPSGQVVSPLGYQRGAVQGPNPGLVLGAPITLNRPFELVYRDPNVAYQQAAALQGPNGNPGSVHLSQLVNLQGQEHMSGAEPHQQQAHNEASSAEPKQLSQAITQESKEASEEPRRSARPTSAHAQARTKA